MAHGRDFPKHERKKAKKAVGSQPTKGSHLLGETKRVPPAHPETGGKNKEA